MCKALFITSFQQLVLIFNLFHSVNEINSCNLIYSIFTDKGFLWNSFSIWWNKQNIIKSEQINYQSNTKRMWWMIKIKSARKTPSTQTVTWFVKQCSHWMREVCDQYSPFNYDPLESKQNGSQYSAMVMACQLIVKGNWLQQIS